MTAIRSDRAAEIHFMALALSFEIETGERFRWKNNPDVMALMLVQAQQSEHHELQWRAQRYLQILKPESRAEVQARIDKIQAAQHPGQPPSGLHRTEMPVSRQVRTIYRGVSKFRPVAPDPVTTRPLREPGIDSAKDIPSVGSVEGGSIRGPVLLEPLDDDWLTGQSARKQGG